MSAINDGGPAFPLPSEPGFLAEMGMTLRDWFAGQALANVYTYHEGSPDRVAEWAYQVADDMIAARKGGAQ